MAEKRMFNKKITDSDAFIQLSSSAQALYFHLNQSADDDGFNNQIQIAMLKAHASNDDLLALLGKNFIIRFESGVIVIKHWRLHNTLRKDRHNPTNYQEELALLGVKENGTYTLSDIKNDDLVAKWLPNGCQMVATDKYSIDKYSIDKNNIYIVEQILDHLNKKTGSKYTKKNKNTISHINARLKEGFTLEDFITVIDTKCDEWLKDERMKQYLRPQTLFATKFESYLNQARVNKPVENNLGNSTNWVNDTVSDEEMNRLLESGELI